MVYLKHVEQKAESRRVEQEQAINYGPPQFATPIRDLQVYEGERVHFEAKVTPAGDPSLTVNWYCNGQLLPASMTETRISCKMAVSQIRNLFVPQAPGSTPFASLASSLWTC